jgi:Putative DNA-binding domain
MNGPPRFSLDSLQQWMQAVIVHPGGVVAGAESAAPRTEIDSVITRSRALSAIERLDIYNRSYFARLLDCMRAEYSVLARALGEELFDSFALGYLQQYPSQSYTLADLGERFPDYLAETRPRVDDTTDASEPQASGSPAFSDGFGIRPTEEEEGDWPEFLIDLARLERTINVVFDGPGTERGILLDHARLAAILPDRWPGARLECVPCLRLLTLSYPINDYFTAVRRGDQPEIPERRASYLAVTRRDYRVYRYPLGSAQFQLLNALLNGETVGAAISQAAEHSATPDERFAADLRDWFYQWTAAGFFLDIK